jgi:hypothetical protein
MTTNKMAHFVTLPRRHCREIMRGMFEFYCFPGTGILFQHGPHGQLFALASLVKPLKNGRTVHYFHIYGVVFSQQKE